MWSITNIFVKVLEARNHSFLEGFLPEFALRRVVSELYEYCMSYLNLLLKGCSRKSEPPQCIRIPKVVNLCSI